MNSPRAFLAGIAVSIGTCVYLFGELVMLAAIRGAARHRREPFTMTPVPSRAFYKTPGRWHRCVARRAT